MKVMTGMFFWKEMLSKVSSTWDKEIAAYHSQSSRAVVHGEHSWEVCDTEPKMTKEIQPLARGHRPRKEQGFTPRSGFYPHQRDHPLFAFALENCR